MADNGPNPEQDPNGPPNRKPMQPKFRMSRPLGWTGMILVILMVVDDRHQFHAVAEGDLDRPSSTRMPRPALLRNRHFRRRHPGQIQDHYRKARRRIASRSTSSARTTPYTSFDDVQQRLRAIAPSETTIKSRYKESRQGLFNMLISIIPWLLIFAFIWFVVFRQLRSSAGGAGMLGNFGRSRHRVSNKELTNITFKDVAGIEEAKQEVTEIIEFLKNPKKFQRLGGRVPRGVLLVGEPGCGKTLMAKAMAGEADVPFFSISGADFVEMFVGVGASRVRDLFKSAKENSPCIIFLDEIDAVGRRRGTAYGGGGHDEREQTLNAILVEMDGFDTSDQVIVIAATNREDILDPALTRPGRFDRTVYVPLPDLKGRLGDPQSPRAQDQAVARS